jgi:hypothetical protein
MAKSYWVVVEGKNFKTGKPHPRQRFGPYASEQEAEQAEVDLVWAEIDSRTDLDHVFHVHIENNNDCSL